MEQLPKIVRQRLQQAEQTKDHVDPNLLSAFAENVLTEREHLVVQTHLAQCGECRDVLAMIAPEWEVKHVAVAAAAAPASTPLPVVDRSVWLSKINLSWGALAACAVIAVGIFSYQNLERRRAAEVAQNNPPSESLPVQDALGSAKSAEVKPVNPDANLVAKAESDLSAARNKRSDKAAAQQAAKEENAFYAKADALTRRAESLPTVRMPAHPPSTIGGAAVGNRIIRPGTPSSAGSFGIMTQSASPAVAADASQQFKKQEEQAQPAMTTSSNQAVVVSAAPAAPLAAEKTDRYKADQDQDKDKEAVAAGSPAPVRGGSTVGALTNSRTLNESLSLEKVRGNERDRLPTSTIPPRWNLSPDGVTLMRSLDGGKSWDMVTVAKNLTMRAVASLGPNVWVGGSAGALYHSIDQGHHWIQIKPVADGVALTADVAKIEFSDSEHCKLTTTNGEVWTTADSGQTWQKH